MQHERESNTWINIFIFLDIIICEAFCLPFSDGSSSGCRITAISKRTRFGIFGEYTVEQSMGFCRNPIQWLKLYEIILSLSRLERLPLPEHPVCLSILLARTAHQPERQQCDTYSEPTNFQEKENLFHFCKTNDNNFATHSSTLIAEPHTHFSAIHLFGRGIFCVVNFQINANVIKRNWKRKRKQLECFTWLVKLFVWIFHLFLCLMRHVPTPVDTK